MPNTQPSLLSRDDTFLGVCEAVGQDFGFDPLWLRVPLAVSVLWNPAAVIGGYLAVGLLVALSRWLYPSVAPVAARPRAEAVSRAPLAGANDDAAVALVSAA